MDALPRVTLTQLQKGVGMLSGLWQVGVLVTSEEEHEHRGNGGREGAPFQGTSLKGQAVFWTGAHQRERVNLWEGFVS